jgi:hypothetical protein
MTTDNGNGSEHREPIRYYVQTDASDVSSVSLLISDRRDYMSQQHDTLDEAASADPLLMIDQIADQSAGTPDYLLPDTPLKEAVFRVLLAGRNEPMSAADVSEELKQRWTMSTYPRDLSPGVIGRLLESMSAYSVGKIVPPEPEPAPEPVSEDDDARDSEA